MLDRIERVIGLPRDKLSYVIQFGSHVYGTAGYQSDHDFLVVADSAMNGREFRHGDCNIFVYRRHQFATDLARHKQIALECFFAPPPFRLIETARFEFKLDKALLYSETVRKAQNSWATAKNELLRGSEQVGLKSLWHAFRIVIFATEIARTGRLSDFAAANPLWEEIRSAGVDWPFLDDYFTGQFEERCTALHEATT